MRELGSEKQPIGARFSLEVGWIGSGSCLRKDFRLSRQKANAKACDVFIEDIRINRIKASCCTKNQSNKQEENCSEKRRWFENTNEHCQWETNYYPREQIVNERAPRVSPPDSERARECWSNELSAFTTAICEQTDAKLPEIFAKDVVHDEKGDAIGKNIAVILPDGTDDAARNIRILIEELQPKIQGESQECCDQGGWPVERPPDAQPMSRVWLNVISVWRRRQGRRVGRFKH